MRCAVLSAACAAVLLRSFVEVSIPRNTETLLVPAPGQMRPACFGRPGARPTVECRASTGDAGAKAQPQRSKLVQAWGAFGVVGYLSYGIQKVVPIVLDGLGAIDQWWQWGLLGACLLFFAYVEGYKGFQLGFSPRVVSRAYIVSEEAEGAPFWHKLLAPAFCIGYFHGTKKRVITSWVVTLVIFAVVVGVKQLDNPYRAIIDAGVIVGLMWGVVSIIVLFVQQITREKPPDFDPALPEDTMYTKPEL